MNHESSPAGPAKGRLSCADARLQASAWLDGEWPFSDPLREHLAACEGCRAAVDGMRALSARLAPLRFDAPARDLWPGIAAAVSRRRDPASRGEGSSRRPLVIRAAAALVGSAATLGLLTALEGLDRGAGGGGTQAERTHWPAALHDDGGGAYSLRADFEGQLLALLARENGGRQEDGSKER